MKARTVGNYKEMYYQSRIKGIEDCWEIREGLS